MKNAQKSLLHSLFPPQSDKWEEVSTFGNSEEDTTTPQSRKGIESTKSASGERDINAPHFEKSVESSEHDEDVTTSTPVTVV